MKTNTKIYIVIFLISLVGGSLTSRYLFSAISISQYGIQFNMNTWAWVCVVFNILNLVSGNILYFKFLKTRKFNSMLFFATVPLTLIFGVCTYFLATINNLKSQTFTLIKSVLKISNTNYNNYYWLAVITIIYLIILFVTFSLLSNPVKKIEKATKKLSFGELKDKITIGGNKQFLEIENSLNKINDNYKKKDDFIKQTNLEYEKFVPKPLIRFLGKKNVLELEIGSQVKKTATLLFCNLRNSQVVSETLSLEENFNFINSYLNVVSPIIKKNGGFVDRYQEDGLVAVFVSAKNAVSCGIQIVKTINQKNLESKNVPSIDVGIGIHTDEMIFGVVGDETRKTPTIISNSVNVSSKLDEVNKKYGSIMVLSKNTLNELPTNFAFLYRYIGNLNIADNKDIISVFECLDVYPRQKREKLNKYHNEFENGVREYVNGKFSVAKDIFEKVYSKEKDDKVCYVYYNNCVENLGRRPLNMHE